MIGQSANTRMGWKAYGGAITRNAPLQQPAINEQKISRNKPKSHRWLNRYLHKLKLSTYPCGLEEKCNCTTKTQDEVAAEGPDIKETFLAATDRLS